MRADTDALLKKIDAKIAAHLATRATANAYSHVNTCTNWLAILSALVQARNDVLLPAIPVAYYEGND